MRRVVVTAMSAATPLGNRVSEFSDNMFSGLSGIKDIRGQTVPKNFPVPFSGPIAPLEGGDSGNPGDVLAYLTRELLGSLSPRQKIDGIVLGNGEGLDFAMVENYQRSQGEDIDLEALHPQSVVNRIVATLDEYKCESPPPNQRVSVYNACASGNVAIGSALERIRTGEWDSAIAGAIDLRCSAPYLMSFHMLGALTVADLPAEQVSRPFTRSRAGFVKSEGAGLLLLEDLEMARARGAEILAEVHGYGVSADAYRLTDGRKDGRGAIRAMEMALKDAELDRSEVDYINAHGTSTLMNDLLETQAIKTFFGERAYKIPVSSLKSQVGHSSVGSGVVEAVASILMLKEQLIAPTINYSDPDPDCDLDYVPNQARPAKITRILSNSFGFGGQNACLVIGNFEN